MTSIISPPVLWGCQHTVPALIPALAPAPLWAWMWPAIIWISAPMATAPSSASPTRQRLSIAGCFRCPAAAPLPWSPQAATTSA